MNGKSAEGVVRTNAICYLLADKDVSVVEHTHGVDPPAVLVFVAGNMSCSTKTNIRKGKGKRKGNPTPYLLHGAESFLRS